MIRKRFAPEPNGFMHLGHAKSAYGNFNYPFEKEDKGECYLRFDDTNPKTEDQIYVDNIINDLKWLGYTPDKISYTSDYFDKIIELTQTLILEGHAYADPSTSEEVKEQRKTKTESPHRDKPIEESMAIFMDMISGSYGEGEMTLRLKIPIEDRSNDCMIDPIAYRVIDAVHYRTGNKFKIYPSYEYSHYIVDSLEGITHSFCTLEFYIRRNLSYWILDKLKLTKPIIEETNRLETDFGILSKRKIKDLIKNDLIKDWDDPRLLTISGMRNKGISAKMINNFCAKQPYSKNMNSVMPLHFLESVIREDLNVNAPRRMAVFNPLKVNLVNHHEIRIFSKPLYPNQKESQNVITTISPVVYIEKEDFMKEANKKYKRMTMIKPVRLKYAGIIQYVYHKEDEKGNILEVDANFIPESVFEGKVNGTIHWVSYKKEAIKIDLITWKYPTRDDIKNGLPGQKIVSTIYLDDILNEEYTEHWQLERQCYINLEPGKMYANYLTGLKENTIAKQLKK